jgi:hypothetical protein
MPKEPWKPRCGLAVMGWSDVTIESPELNRDFSGFREIRLHVFGPEGAPPDLKAQLFAKSGSTWQWIDAGWQPLSQTEWTKLRLPVEKIDDRTQVRTVGVKIGGNSPFTGSVFIDLVELAGDAVVPAPQVAVVISDITENTRIVGRISGVPPEKVDQYKVLVYVKTDKWYIHPYERGGEGLSFASSRRTWRAARTPLRQRPQERRPMAINRDGSWRIETVKRRFPADLVAALVVHHDYTPPPTVEDLKDIDSLDSYTEDGRGRL